MPRATATSIILFVSLLFAGLIFPTTTFAASYFVSSSGSDSSTGTQASPFKTISRAVSAVSAGDTVTVLNGTYTGDFTITKSGTSSQPITFSGSGSSKLVTNRSQKDASVIIDANYVIFRNFDVEGNIHIQGQNNIVENNYVHDSYEQGGIQTAADKRDSADSSNNTIRNNTIYRAVQAGLYIEGRNHLVEGNDVSRTQDHAPDGSGQTDSDGMRFFGSGHIIRNNYIHDVYQSDALGEPHIDMMQTWEYAYNIVFDSNVFHNPNPTGSNRILMLENQEGEVRDLTWVNNIFIFADDSSAFLNFNRKIDDNQGPITNMRVVNNTFYYVGGNADKAASFQNISGVTFKNNLLINAADSSQEYIEVSGASSNIDVGYNAIYSTTGEYPDQSNYTGDLWQINPLVMSLSGLDFRLQANSPLIDAGTSTTLTTKDHVGVSRPQGSAYDIGAYEFSTSGPQPSPSPQASPIIELPSPTASPQAPPNVLGDLNGDGIVSQADYTLFLPYFGQVSCTALADFDDNCMVNIFDLNILIAAAQ